MKRASLAATCLLVVVAVQAQPTTYFPHHLGDMWEYFVLDGVGNDTLQVTVIFDSTDPSGSSQVIHQRQLLNPARPPWFSWYDGFTIDTIGDILGSGLSPPNRLVYRLNIPVGQWWFVHYPGGAGGDVAKVVAEYPSTVFGQQTIIKEIAYFFAGDTSDTTQWLWQYTELLAEGFGTIFRGDGDLGYNLYLRGCVIDGQFYGDTTLVSVPESNNDDVPAQFTLYQNYPNPFNPQTTIRFEPSQQAVVTLAIYDILGKEVTQLLTEQVYPPGTHEIHWDGNTRSGSQASTGAYLLTLQADDRIFIRRMLLLR